MATVLSTPSNWTVFARTNDGCTTRPVTMSVSAKQTNRMLELLSSLGLLFTDIITNTLNRTVKGQVITLMIMVMMKVVFGSGPYCPSLSVVIFGFHKDIKYLTQILKKNVFPTHLIERVINQ